MGNVAIFKGKLVKFLAKAGILVPARPDADRSLTPTAGETAFNTTANKLEVYDGTTWTQLGAGGGGGGGALSVTQLNDATPVDLNNYVFASGTSSYPIVRTITLQDNDIYIGGLFNYVAKRSDIKVFNSALVNSSNSSLLSAINPTAFDGPVFCSVVVGNYIYVGGDFTSYNDKPATRIAKISLIDQSLDTIFNTEIGCNGSVSTICVDNTGNNIFIGGTFTSCQGVSINRIAKLNSTNAKLDTVFDPGTGFSGEVKTIAFGASQQLYVGGVFTQYQGRTVNYIIKINSLTAEINKSFYPVSGSVGFASSGSTQVNTIVLDNTESYLYAAGFFSSYKGTTRNSVVKINALTGDVDLGFDSADGFNTQTVFKLALSNDNLDLFAGGSFTSYKGITNAQRVVKIKTVDATKDSTFNSVSGFDGTVNDIALDTTGTNLYATGTFTSYKVSTRIGVAKLSTTDAAVDSTFNSSNALRFSDGSSLPSGRTIVLYDSNNKLFVGGSFKQYDLSNNYIASGSLTKINKLTGNIDPIFNVGTGFNGGIVYKIVVDSTSNSVYVGGSFSFYKATGKSNIVKLNATDASIISPFTASVSGTVLDMILDNSTPVKNLYIGGSFSIVNGISRNNLAKLLSSDGSNDGTFDTTTGTSSTVNSILLDANETNLYAAGTFTTYKSLSRGRIVKLKTLDASIDTVFAPTTGFDSNVRQIRFNAAKTEIYAVGSFTTYQSVTHQRIAKLDANNAVSTTQFNTLTGLNTSATSLHVDTDDSLYVGISSVAGSTYKGVARTGVIKINGINANLDTKFHILINTIAPSPECIVKDNENNLYIGHDTFYTAYRNKLAYGFITLDSTTAYYKTIQTRAALSTYQLQNSDSNAVLIVNSDNVLDIIIPSGLSSSFNCSIVLNGLGNVRIITNSDFVNLNSSTGFRITTRYGRAYIVASSTNNFNISGNVVV